MDHLFCSWCCSRPTYSTPDESSQLTREVRRPSANQAIVRIENETIQQDNPDLPPIQVVNVTESFRSKLIKCPTSPVPSLGAYGVPFPAIRAIHIIDLADSTLKIIVAQQKPGYFSQASINLHHVIFPDYGKSGDRYENYRCAVSIRNIQVNGEPIGDIRKQPIHVHNGLFSPELPPVVAEIDDRTVAIVTARARMPRFPQGHLYQGVKAIHMLNIIFPTQIAAAEGEQTIQTMLELAANPALTEQVNQFMSL